MEAINRDGWAIVSSNAGMQLWRGAAGTRTPVLPFSINHPAMNTRTIAMMDASGSASPYPSPQFVGSFSTDGLTSVAVLLEENLVAQTYELFDLNRLATPPVGWRLERATDINSQGVITALLRNPPTGQSKGAILLPVDLGVDNNRDGTLSLRSSGDQTSEQKPYRFWLNNDHDNYGDDSYDDQQDHPWTTQSLDNANTVIESQRDLEDLSRLHFRVNGIEQALASGSITLGLKWAHSISGAPGIRVFKAVESDGATKYLSDAATASDQMSNGRNALGVVQGTAVLDLPTSFWTGATPSSVKYLLFEGLSEGEGELTRVFKRGATVIGQGGSVFLHLLDVRKMYERWRIAAAASFPDPDTSSVTTVSGVSSVSDANGYPFQPAWDEDTQDKSYIVCVHGWRKNYNGARSDEITMFKRLWQRGLRRCR